MTKSNILFIGMDVHKESIEIALADDGAHGEVRRYGRIGGTLDALKKTLRKLVSEDKRSISAMRPGHVATSFIDI